MLKVIEDKEENRKAQKRLVNAFKKLADRTEALNIGWQGGSTWTPISWSSALQLRWSFLDDKDGIPRYWRAFSTKEPHWKSNHSHIIQCEINSPFQGSNRQVAAAFAEDSKGNIFLIHRGNIGGGRKGIGKSLFFSHTQSEVVTVQDAQGETEAVLVGALDSVRFCHQIAEFVHDVARIKERVTTDGFRAPKKQYSPEYSGKKIYQIESSIVAECDHGLVVDAMRQELVKRGLTVANDRSRDLYIVNEKNRKVRVLFEFKTDNSRSSIYSAIGQLLFNSSPKIHTLVAVLPETVAAETAPRLKELGIDCVTYSWEENRPRFMGLNAVLKK